MSRSRDLANLAGDATGLETLTVSDITDLTASATELNYSDGVGSALQTQINAKAPIASPTFTGTTNVSSGVTLPAGHVLQVKVFNGKVGSTFSTAETSYQNLPNTDWESDIYPNITITGGNKIFVSTQMEVLIYGGGADNQGIFRIYDVTNTSSRGVEGNMYSHNANAYDGYECAYVNIHALFTQSSSVKQEFTFSIKAGSGGTVEVWHAHGTMTLMEVKA